MFNSTTEMIDKLNITKTLYSKFDKEAEQELSKQLIDEAFHEVYHRGDMVMMGFVGLHFLLALIFAFFYNTWTVTWAVGLVSFATFYLSVFFYPKRFRTRVIAGIVLQAFVLLYIYQLQGLPEIRFFFFTSFVILIVYQDWKAMWPSAILFFGQMVVFSFLSTYVDALHLIHTDYKDFIMRLVPRTITGKIDYLGLGFYVGVSFLQLTLTGIWASFLRRQTIGEVLATQNLLIKQKEIEEANIQLEEKVQQKTYDLQETIESLQANDEELRQNMEELQATQDEIESQRKQLMENQSVMQKVEIELRERQATMERSQWLESNLSKFDDVMRLNYDKSLETFSDIIMLHLAELLGTTQGAFYIFDELDDTLKMTGGYACTPQTVRKAEFRAGEGMLGQILKTKKMIHLDSLPDDGAVIESALTKVRSKSLVIVPLLYNEDTQGVIEIAILEYIDELHLEFLQRLAKNIASMLQSIRGILSTQKLLTQSQEMTSRLRENAKELEITKQEAEQKADEFQRQFTAINRSMLVIEFTPEGDILSANDKFLALAKYSLEELAGKHQSIFLAEKYAQSAEYRQLWHRVRNNDYAESEYECIAKDQSVFWMRTHYYTLGEGKNKKIMVLAYDTTVEKEQDKMIEEQLKALKTNEEIMHENMQLMKNLQEEVERKANELQQQINAINISTAMIEYDANGLIQFVNDKFLEITGYEQEDLMGQSHKILLEDKFAHSTAYQRFWDRLKQNEFIDGEFEIIAQKGNTIWLRGSYYPVADKKGRLVKVMQLATNITNEVQQEDKIKDYLMDLEKAQTQLKDMTAELQAKISAIESFTGLVEFNPDGEIIHANEKFLEFAKYNTQDLVGKHHKVLVSKEMAESKDYKKFWDKLNKNQFVEGEFEQLARDNSTFKLRASYFPVLDAHNQVSKIIGIVSKLKDAGNGVDR